MDQRQLINRINTKEWVKANSMQNSHKYRDAFVKKYGGVFERIGAAWVWNDKLLIEEKPTKLWIFYKNDGMMCLVENFMDFCRKNDLSKSAMYDVMNGRRKSHKGFVKVEKVI